MHARREGEGTGMLRTEKDRTRRIELEGKRDGLQRVPVAERDEERSDERRKEEAGGLRQRRAGAGQSQKRKADQPADRSRAPNGSSTESRSTGMKRERGWR
jgi:hypothetical protein